MSNTCESRTAFPCPMGNAYHTGLTPRAFAAIQLRVPDSGIEWLDKMIDKSRIDMFAGMALQGLCAAPIPTHQWQSLAEAYQCELQDAPVKNALKLANSMLLEQNKENK